MEKFKSLFKGNYTKRQLTHYYLPLGIGLHYLFLTIAWLFFPYIEEYPYNWTTSMISRLGKPQENPIGWIFFSAAFIPLGFLLIILIPYLYQRFSKLAKREAKIVRISLTFSSIGLIGIAAIPNFLPNIFGFFHMLNAVLIYIGMFLTVLITPRIIFLERKKNGKENSIFPNISIKVYFIFLTYFLICTVFLAIADKGTSDRYYLPNTSTILILSRPFWEWQAFFAAFCLLGTICFLLPENIV